MHTLVSRIGRAAARPTRLTSCKEPAKLLSLSFLRHATNRTAAIRRIGDKHPQNETGAPSVLVCPFVGDAARSAPYGRRPILLISRFAAERATTDDRRELQRASNRTERSTPAGAPAEPIAPAAASSSSRGYAAATNCTASAAVAPRGTSRAHRQDDRKRSSRRTTPTRRSGLCADCGAPQRERQSTGRDRYSSAHARVGEARLARYFGCQWQTSARRHTLPAEAMDGRRIRILLRSLPRPL